MPILFKDWPEFTEALPPSRIKLMYDEGFKGAYYDRAAREHLLSELQFPNASDVAHTFGFADQFANQLVIPFVHVEALYPGSLPGPAQGRGDCVSHSTKNAVLGTMCCEVVAGLPDEVSGKVEKAPEVSIEGIKNGVLSTETFYWYRRHGGDGWSCDAAARVALRESGAMLRQPYPELGIDLTRYSASLAGKYGRTPPSGPIAKEGQLHLIRDSTVCDTFEECRDMLGKGFFLTTCGSEAWSDRRDENGLSRRQGTWAHAMGVIGADDRPEIKQLYGEPLVLVLNSWGIWNSGGRRILGTNIDIPNGSFWSRWSDFRRRQIIAFAGLSGWARPNLPSASPGFI